MMEEVDVLDKVLNVSTGGLPGECLWCAGKAGEHAGADSGAGQYHGA